MSDMRYEIGCPFDHPGICATEYAGNDDFAAIYDVAPILPGHTLIVPRRHVARLRFLGEDESCRFFAFAHNVTRFLVAHFEAEGFDWAMQDGVSAGQTVGHVHLHVIPRWPGDLPSPGDWYSRLQLPITTSPHGAGDSAARLRLNETDLFKIVASLRTAATEAGI
ncbi:MAG: HIT family protein [Pseudonocardiaceae bacterium]